MIQKENMLKIIKVLFLITLVLGFFAAWIWLSGYFFMVLGGLDKDTANMFTLWEYYSTYGNDENTIELLGKGITIGIILMNLNKYHYLAMQSLLRLLIFVKLVY